VAKSLAIGAVIRLSTAIFGGACALALAPALQRSGGAGALPGAMQAANLDPHGPLFQLIAVLVALYLGAIVGGRVAPFLQTVRWARTTYCIILVSSLLPLMTFGGLRHVVVHGIVAAVVVAARRFDPRFTRDDVVLLPVTLAVYFAFLDLDFGHTVWATFERAAILVFVYRWLIGVKVRAPRPALAFAAAPLALALEMRFASGRVEGALALLWVGITPLLVIAFAPMRKRAASFLAYVAYPIALAAYPIALFGIGSAPAVDVFEDSHNLLPAAEMMRGERPYTDIIPIHGFVADAAVDFAVMKAGGDSVGSVLRVRRVIGSLTLACIYFIALAATGSSAAGCLASLLAIALFPWSTIWLRPIPALAALAFCAVYVRTTANRWMTWAGGAIAAALLTSLDFGLYSLAVAVIAAVRSRRRGEAARALASGFAILVVPAIAMFAIFGFATDFFRVSFALFRNATPYVIGPTLIPDCLRSFALLATQFSDPHCLSALIWVIAVITTAVAVTRRRVHARSDAVWYIGLWMTAAAASWIERIHAYYEFAAPAFVVSALFLLRRRQRTAAIAIAVAVIFLARPFAHVFDAATQLRRSGARSLEEKREPAVMPRAGGAAFTSDTTAALGSVRKYLSSMRAADTFYDFANAGLLYYVFDRDCPIVYPEVPMYEREDQQNAVIQSIDRNRSVRAVLIAFPGAYSDIDRIPNRLRAPLVWQYIEKNFEPAVDENGVVIWQRRY
jgi:hypothetical protein